MSENPYINKNVSTVTGKIFSTHGFFTCHMKQKYVLK